MANDEFRPDMFNPLLLWTDLGLRAIDMTVTSFQNMSETADRLTRGVGDHAGAGDEASASAIVVDTKNAAALPAGIAGFESLQRSIFELASQAWVFWLSSFGAMALPGAKAALGETLARSVDWAQSHSPESGRSAPASHSTAHRSAARLPRERAEAGPATADRQHALASTEAKRRKAKAKPRRARHS
ncbi:MAG TPA: hypothetical protein VLJ58_06850 [Ramlibacter sp.]|nr:hypothetical protein [Ramlibacter sp.]